MERKACIHGHSCGWDICMMEECPEFKQRPQKKCEHVIGLYYTSDDRILVSLPDLKWRIRDTKEFNEMCRTYGHGIIVRKEYTLKDYADKRKSTNLTRFDFCPLCGEKIDWKAIGRDKR